MHGGHDHDEHEHEHEHADEHAHGHAHAHAGEHAHGHPHEPTHDHAPAMAATLERGAGKDKTLFLDCFSGIAGDMTIAALLDLGVPLSVIEQAVMALPLGDFHLHRGHAHRSGIVATSFEVHVDGAQPERTYGTIDRMLTSSTLDPDVSALARRIFRKLAEAEAHVHKMPLFDVHFHEVGAVDAIVDIVGAAAAFTYLGADVSASPLPMGHGFVNARHGILPLPAPATVACLRGVPTYAADVEAELVTPTGAAIVATVASRFERWPALSPELIGFGAGQRELADRPNLLRAVLGVREGDRTERSAEAAATHVVIEANVDDLTGELASHAIEALFVAGALDAWATPIAMKKGRPGLTLSALARAPQADAVAVAMLRETTTIGVRRTPVTRIERPRRVVSVETAYGAVRVKVSEGPYGPPQLKPEFDDCARAAELHGVPVREVLAAAMAAARA